MVWRGSHEKIRKNYDLAVTMYQRGLSIAEVAAYYGISRQAMHDILRRRKVRMRSSKRKGKRNHFYRGTRASDRSQNLLEKALQRGLIQKKQTCEQCGKAPKFKDGRSGVQAHHDDYNKPLDVRWLCQKCHHLWHRQHKAIPLERR
jgi:predicted DNA-binding protein YlxM (UPF0122 family)